VLNKLLTPHRGSGCEALTPDDIAEVVVFTATRRENLVVADTLVFPNHQVSGVCHSISMIIADANCSSSSQGIGSHHAPQEHLNNSRGLRRLESLVGDIENNKSPCPYKL
jgi:hypothetical protein